MKVFILNSVCGYGSTGRIVSDTYSVLKSLGHQVKVAYGIGNSRFVDENDLIKVNGKVGYYVHNAIARITDRAGFYSIVQTKRLVKEIERFSPDVIQLHNLHGFYINIKILFDYLAKADIPVVMTLHDCWTMTGHCSHFDYANCDLWKTGCHNCPIKNEYPISLVMDQSKRNYKDKKALFTSVKNMTIVTPSEWLANIARESYLGKCDVKCIPNGIDLDVFYPRESDFREKNGIAQNEKMVLAVSSIWGQRKGLYDLYELAGLLPNDYKLVIVGLTEEQLEKCPSNIIGIMRTNSVDELAEIYSSADVFVNTTYEDTFPTVNLEALACGTPVITYNTGGSPEAANENSGVVVKQGDIDAMIKAIKEWRIFNSNQATARAQSYDKNICYKKYIELYDRIVKNKGNK